jgi:hypothetical protein
MRMLDPQEPPIGGRDWIGPKAAMKGKRMSKQLALRCQQLPKVQANVSLVLPMGNRRLPHGTT